MASLSDLKLKYRILIQHYPFRRVDWRPGLVWQNRCGKRVLR